MIKVNKKIKYGFRAMLFIAQENKTVSVKKIADAQQIPYAYLEQIIQELKQAGLVKSQRGSDGGFSLAKSPNQISLGDVVKALENNICLADCLSGCQECCDLESSCLAKKGWQEIQESLINSLNQINLKKLLNQQSIILND